LSAGLSNPPEKLLQAMSLQPAYPIRWEPQLIERLYDDLLFRGSVGNGK
jgi:hypothetical protein